MNLAKKYLDVGRGDPAALYAHHLHTFMHIYYAHAHILCAAMGQSPRPSGLSFLYSKVKGLSWIIGGQQGSPCSQQGRQPLARRLT